MRYLLMLVLFGTISLASLGCEASGSVDTDDDDAKIKVDVDD